MLDKQQLNQLYQYCYSLTGEASSAYDLLQTSLEKHLRSRSSNTVHLAYIRRIIRNQFIDNCRRQKIVDFEELDESTLIDIDTQSLEQCVINQHLLSQLWPQFSATEREILYLWSVLGYSTDELAKFLQMPRGTLLAKIHRLRKKVTAYTDEQAPQTYQGGNSQ